MVWTIAEITNEPYMRGLYNVAEYLSGNCAYVSRGVAKNQFNSKGFYVEGKDFVPYGKLEYFLSDDIEFDANYDEYYSVIDSERVSKYLFSSDKFNIDFEVKNGLMLKHFRVDFLDIKPKVTLSSTNYYCDTGSDDWLRKEGEAFNITFPQVQIYYDDEVPKFRFGYDFNELSGISRFLKLRPILSIMNKVKNSELVKNVYYSGLARYYDVRIPGSVFDFDKKVIRKGKRLHFFRDIL